MNSAATYIIVSAGIGVTAIGFIPQLREAMFALFRMSSALIGTPWP